MAWVRAVLAYAVWLLVHGVAGVIFALAIVYLLPHRQGLDFAIDGLVAGLIFGLGQWLVLEWLFGGMYLWLVATVPASYFSWLVGYVIAFITIGLGGWIGAGVSAAAQTFVLAVTLKKDRRGSPLPLALVWFPAAMLGAIVFYSNFWPAINSRPAVSLLAPIATGSVGFGALTGAVIAALAATTARSSAGPRA